jgi:hypothetical protein
LLGLTTLVICQQINEGETERPGWTG